MLNKLINKIKGKPKNNRIIDDAVAQQFIDDEEFPFLVSFPRTGSHWLRMLMELYFDKPSLKLIFFEPYFESSNFTCFHRHDDDLKIERKNVMYLYREPVATVFSQLKFYNEDINDVNIEKWAVAYAKHLQKWLVNESFTTQKTIINYDKMRADLPSEFAKVCDFFGVGLDVKKLELISQEVSKEKLKEKTKHDNRVVNLKHDYAEKRKSFKAQYGEKIMRITLDTEQRLSEFL